MPLDLLQRVEEAFSNLPMESLAGTIEVDEADIQKDQKIISAAVLAGLMKKCTTERGVSVLSGLLKQPVEGGDIKEEESSPEISIESLIEEGDRALDRIFGSGLNDLIGAVGGYCSTSRYKLRKLFAVTGKVTIDVLDQIKSDKTFDDKDIATLVLSQGSRVNEALPDNLFAALGLRRLGGFANKLVAERTESIEKILAKPEASALESLLLKRLAPVGVGAVLLIIAWTLFRGCGG